MGFRTNRAKRFSGRGFLKGASSDQRRRVFLCLEGAQSPINQTSASSQASPSGFHEPTFDRYVLGLLEVDACLQDCHHYRIPEVHIYGHNMMQDAFCPWCGEIFRVRAHSKECQRQHMPMNEGLFQAIKLVSDAYVQWWITIHGQDVQEDTL